MRLDVAGCALCYHARGSGRPFAFCRHLSHLSVQIITCRVRPRLEPRRGRLFLTQGPLCPAKFLESRMTDPTPDKIPVTVLTGYLGAGKTTLLNRILSEPHGQKYAVIVNAFGEIGIDNDLIVRADEEIFEVTNGCICCTVRRDLIRLFQRPMRSMCKLGA